MSQKTRKKTAHIFFSVGCVIPHDRLRFPFNDMEISMIDICILDILIISILQFFHAYKRRKAHFSTLMSMEKLHAYHLGPELASDLTIASVSSLKKGKFVFFKEFHC